MPLGERTRLYYPGLIDEEARLWRRWLEGHEQDFSAFQYNVRVGEGLRPPSRPLTGDDTLDETFRRLWKLWTQRRVDVVGFKRDEVWLFEVEERPGARALGQLMLYQTLYPRTDPHAGYLQPAVVCVFLGPDMRSALEDAGAVVFQLGRA